MMGNKIKAISWFILLCFIGLSCSDRIDELPVSRGVSFKRLDVQVFSDAMNELHFECDRKDVFEIDEVTLTSIRSFHEIFHQKLIEGSYDNESIKFNSQSFKGLLDKAPLRSMIEYTVLAREGGGCERTLPVLMKQKHGKLIINNGITLGALLCDEFYLFLQDDKDNLEAWRGWIKPFAGMVLPEKQLKKFCAALKDDAYFGVVEWIDHEVAKESEGYELLMPIAIGIYMEEIYMLSQYYENAEDPRLQEYIIERLGEGKFVYEWINKHMLEKGDGWFATSDIAKDLHKIHAVYQGIE